MNEQIVVYLLQGMIIVCPVQPVSERTSASYEYKASCTPQKREASNNEHYDFNIANKTKSVLDLFEENDGSYAFQAPTSSNLELEKTSSDEAIEIDQIINRAQSVLGLNNVQLSKIIGVSRPSLYNHISGKEQPKSMEGYKSLHSLVSRVEEEVNGNISLGIKSVLVNGKTLLSRLKSSNFNEDEFISAAKNVAKRVSTRSNLTKITDTKQKSVTRSLGNMG